MRIKTIWDLLLKFGKNFGAHTPHPKFFYTPIMQILVLAPIGTLPAMGVFLIAHSVPTWKAPHIARPMPDMQASHIAGVMPIIDKSIS